MYFVAVASVLAATFESRREEVAASEDGGLLHPAEEGLQADRDEESVIALP